MANVKCPKCESVMTGVSAGKSIKCPKCGNVMKLVEPANSGSSMPQNKATKNEYQLVTRKLVSSILLIILFVLVPFQSCAIGAYNVLSNDGKISGNVGMIVAITLLAGEIVSTATRKNEGNGDNIALIVLLESEY